MAGPSDFIITQPAEKSCATTLDARQTLGAAAFEPPTAQQSQTLWDKFHLSHPGLGADLDERGRADLHKLEIAALQGNAQAFADVVKDSQNDPSADNALKAFQKELASLSHQIKGSGADLVAQPDGTIARRNVFGARVKMRDTNAITFSMNTSTTELPPCDQKPHQQVSGELSSLSVGPGTNGSETFNANRFSRSESTQTVPAAFFRQFSPALQQELEHATRDLL